MKTLARSKRGIFLAIAGGILGGPVGIVLSPATLAFVNSITKKQGAKTNRFLIWAILGAIGAPFSLILSLMIWIIGPCIIQPSSDYCKNGIELPTPN